jgi:hypothetical protein
MNRRILTIVFLIGVMIFSCTDEKMSTDLLPNITASYTDNELVIDGLLNESIWKTTQSVILRENRTGKSVTDTSYLTVAQIAYNQYNLYIAFTCNDPDIWGNFTERDQYLWTEENVEVFVDTDTISNTYVEIEVSPNNIIFDSYIVDPVDIDIEETKKFDLPGIKTAIMVYGSVNVENDQDKRWTVEILVPFKDLVDKDYMIIPEETEWRINFYRIDRRRTGESTGYAWSPTGARFHKPPAFGVLNFGRHK